MPGRRRFIDYSAALKVAPTASADDFRVAYRRLVRSAHPDLNPDDRDAAARTQLIIEAHFVLRDPDRRGAFDARRAVVMERRPCGQCTGLDETRDLTRRAARRAQLKVDDARPVSAMAGAAKGAGPPHSEPDEQG